MLILALIKRVWSPYANHATRESRPKDIKNKQQLSECERDAQILELMDNPKPTSETIEELAKLMGQTEEPRL